MSSAPTTPCSDARVGADPICMRTEPSTIRLVRHRMRRRSRRLRPLTESRRSAAIVRGSIRDTSCPRHCHVDRIGTLDGGWFRVVLFVEVGSKAVEADYACRSEMGERLVWMFALGRK